MGVIGVVCGVDKDANFPYAVRTASGKRVIGYYKWNNLLLATEADDTV